MPKDFAIKNKTTFTGYAGLQAGVTRATSMIGTSGAILGAKVERNNNYVKAEVGAGAAFTGKVEAGHEFNIGKNMGLELSANAYSAKSNGKNTVTLGSEIHSYEVIKDKAGNINVTSNPETVIHEKAEWSPSFSSAGAKVQLNYRPTKRFTLGAGLEAGIKHSGGINTTFTSKSVNKGETVLNEKTIPLGASADFEATFNNTATKGYITPTVSLKAELGKNNKIELFGDANLNNQAIGARIKF